MTPPLVLNDPSGSDIANGMFYVSDRDGGTSADDPLVAVVRWFNMTNGAPVGEVRVPRSTGLNDIEVADDGTIYATQTGTGGEMPDPTSWQVWKITPDGTASMFIQGAPLRRPNGIAFDQQGNIVVVNIGNNEVLTFSPAGELTGACFPRCWSSGLLPSRRRTARRELDYVRFRGLAGNGMEHDRYKNTQSETTCREDVAQGQSLAHQTGLHRRCPGLASEPQRSVRPNEIVVAPQKLDVPVELVCATRVAGRVPAQVRRALPNREVEALDERRVQGLGILRRQQRGLQPTRRADLHASLDPDDPIVPPSLEHLPIDAR